MIYLVSLEPLETRYTAQWKKWIWDAFEKEGFQVTDIEGPTLDQYRTGASFLNFYATNIWKSHQIAEIARLFNNGTVKEGDIFFHYDAWHYGVIAIHYMSSLAGPKVKQCGIWHAGSYDPNDLLGMAGLYDYYKGFELSLFNCLDKSFVATRYHRNLIASSFFLEPRINDDTIVVTGLPYDFSQLAYMPIIEKENIFIFPHRISPEKQPDIFLDLRHRFPEYEFIVCQDLNLSKDEYHSLLRRAKVMFSANLQETWGIGTFEALASGCLIIVPDRLSYQEMYDSTFKYPSDWTRSQDHYLRHREDLVDFIRRKLDNYHDGQYTILLKQNLAKVQRIYCDIHFIIEEVKKLQED
jgi:glycosyltransferase involved in cell wall biosynthesis